MPRSSLRGVTSAFERVQAQARNLLTNLRNDIRNKEAELRRLKDEQGRLSKMLGPAGRGGSSPAMRRGGGRTGGGRINWRTVLKQMPKQFKAADVRKYPGLRNKRPSEIFAAITRWIDAGLARRKSRGAYERK